MIDALPLLLGPEGYQISRSVRLRSSASAYFNRTMAAGSGVTVYTFSAWVKRGELGTIKPIVQGYLNNNNYGHIIFKADNTIEWREVSVAANYGQVNTNAVFRDPSAWYHIVVVRNGTSLLIYVNGVSQTLTVSTGVNAAGGYLFGASTEQRIGRDQVNSAFFDGYLTECYLIDGQALTPSSFGETNAVTGVWQPKKYTGTYGTNGFYLNFSDNSAATAAAIGKDYSGNGNNWTPNNISVTAGATYDSMLDVPTQWADGGNGRGNYATWSPIDHPTTFIAPTNGNLSQNCNTSAWTLCVPTFAIPDGSGLWQWELVQTGTANGANAIGVCLTTVQASVTGDPSGRVGCSGTNNTGTTFINGATSGTITYPTVGNTITCLYDATNRTLQVFDNGTSRGTITGLPAGDVRPFVAASSSNGSPTFVANFGQRTFAYNQGGKALNTLNLPTPTILKGNQYFDATLYTGNGTGITVTNSGSMQPDFVWAKNRSNAADHALYDVLRTAMLSSNTTAAEVAASNVVSYNSNGFTISGGDSRLNANGNTYVGWQWKEGATQGFDIVTYTGDGVDGRTVAHNLGVAPKMVIVKSRSTVTDWNVKHASLSSNNVLQLNATNAQNTPGSGYIGDLNSSTTFTLKNGGAAITNVNGNGTTYVAYLFAAVAGYSAFGSYTGNGSADGAFVFTGFRPRFVMVKRTDAAGQNWVILDTSRDTSNVAKNGLYPNLSNAEDAGWNVDILSNGFKPRDTASAWNASGGTYIYAAFSEVGFKYALGR